MIKKPIDLSVVPYWTFYDLRQYLIYNANSEKEADAIMNYIEDTFQKTYKDSYDNGYDEGYDEGYEDGYDAGYNEGIDDCGEEEI